MDTHKIQTVEKLCYKIYNHTASIEEKQRYYELILDESCAQHVEAIMEKLLMESPEMNALDAERRENVYASITRLLAFEQKVKRPVFSYYLAAAAAAVLMFVFLGLYQYQQLAQKERIHPIEQDIAPGNESALLILQDGKQIALSAATNGEIANDNGIKISNDQQGQITYTYLGNAVAAGGLNTVKTNNGQAYTIQLADGTKVWLNAASSLQFQSNLAFGGTRQVRLIGEAYFEVAKDAKHPFIVQTDRQTVRVLGTHFNVSAYANDDAGVTTVLEGRVSVKHHTVEHILNPGDQAVTTSRGTSVAKTNAGRAVDWQQGDFVLNNITFEDAMKKIARWYDIEVIYEGNVDKTMLAGGWVSKKQPLSAVLHAVESLDLVRFERKGHTLIVRPYKPN